MIPLALLWLACSGKDDGTTPSDTDTDTDTPPTGDTGSAGHTGTEPGPLGLVVCSVPEAPGVLHVSSALDATGWSLEVEGVSIEPGADGVAVVMGHRQGSALTARVFQGDDEVGELALAVPTAPELWTVSVIDADRSDVAKGVLALGIVARDRYDAQILVVDGATGGLVWWHNPGPEWDISAVGERAAGGGFVWGQYDATRSTDLAQAVTLSVDGREHTLLDTPGAHHVTIEPADGRFAMIEFDVRADTPSPYGPIDVTSDRIVEVDADGGGRAVLFTAIDDLFGGVNDYTCSHNQRTEELFGLDAMVQWTHGNSLVHLPDSDSLLLYERWIDTLVKVDRQGNLIWSLSGPFSDFTGPGGESLWEGQDRSTLWSHGHFTDGWEGGVLMYDNGSHAGQARVVEVAIDEVAMTAEVVWSLDAPNASAHTVLGDARRLPSGNVLICWTVLGLVQEVTRAGEVVWEMQGDADLWFSRMVYAPSLEAFAAPR